MAHVDLFPGSHEIVEIEEEELNPKEHYRSNSYMKHELRREEKDRRSLASNAGHINSLEDDLNQLFEMFNRRASSHGTPAYANYAGTSRKNTSKKAVKAGGSYSPGHGISERVNLKQALRGLCLSQASEMAAMKRSTKAAGGSSEAGRILTMYRNVVVEERESQHFHDDGRGMLEISLVPEETTFDSFQSIPQNFPVSSDLWPSNRSSLAEKGVGPTQMQNGVLFESKDSGNHQFLKPENPVSVTSPSFPHVDDNIPNMINRNISTVSSSPSSRNGMVEVAESNMSESQMSKFDLLHKEEKNARSPRRSDLSDKAWEHSKTGVTENVNFSASPEFASQKPLAMALQKEKHALLQSSSRLSDGKTSLELARKRPEHKEMTPVSAGGGNQTKVDTLQNDENAHVTKLGEKALDLSNSNKLASKEPAPKSPKTEAKESSLRAVQKDKLKTVVPSTGSSKGRKASKSTKHAHHFVKPLIKTRNFVKRKSKKNVTSDNISKKNTRCEFNNDLYSSPNPIVCPRCQCVVTDAWKESSNQESPVSDKESPEETHQPEESPVSYQDSPVSPFVSLSAEVSSEKVISDVSTPGPSSEILNKSKSKTIVAEVIRGNNSKPRDKGEFTQSSKDSPGECSSSTSISEESNLSRPSFCDRPHMSKDVRWEAIRHVRFQHGTLGLRHFNLLKKLGCGDIGTVYLAELIGTHCLFAIKVMDNEFLARRKKISRAQTEKEILRMLDHPFLPTLYCQFTSDNLSCLVMEYCPGGDLHVLRQRQPGRCFTEQAARFYVAEVLLALEYLHMLGVVYRDLKPENILVREDGHIMLSDFDLSLRCAVNPTLLVSSSISDTSRAKTSGPCVDSRCVQPLCIEPTSCQVTCFTPRRLTSSSSSVKSRKQKPDLASELRPLLQLVAEPTTARSNSFVGTHEYLAPEIIKGEGHGSAVDWWTFGIFLYELLYGKTPFKGAGNEETLANVVLQSLKFPDSPLVSLQARDLIATLLVKEPENRLGTERGAAEIKQHPFFDGLNWALIRCAVPPELPEHRSYGISKAGSGSGEHLEFEVF